MATQDPHNKSKMEPLGAPEGSSFPFRAAQAASDVAVRRYAPSYLARGGAAGLAVAAAAGGATPSAAARQAAQTGKGFLAELRLATEYNVQSGLLDLSTEVLPNASTNHCHADLEIFRGETPVGTVQVGVGGTGYLLRKANGSRADQVVINREARGECS